MDTREELVAPCGLDCGICELYLSKDSGRLKEALIEAGIPKEALPCAGCRAIEGRCPVIQGTCATFACAARKGVRFCSECSAFPCAKLAPAADKANVLPHNMKMYNLCVIQQRGVAELIACPREIKHNYHKGTMLIGEGPCLGEESRESESPDRD